MASISVDQASRLDITYRRKDTFQLSVDAVDSDAVAINFTGYTATMQIKAYGSDTSLLTIGTATGEIALTSGNIAITIPASSMNLGSDVKNYDLQLTVGGVVSTWLYGRFIEREDISA